MFRIVFLGCALLLSSANASEVCGNVYNIVYGPYDYSDPKNSGALETVEKRHFTTNVDKLVSGESASILGDLNYTLRKFPNHYKALWARVRFHVNAVKKNLFDETESTASSVECYFYRALQFKPEDAVVWQLYGMYFHMKSDYLKAIEKYKQAEVYGQSAELYYNLGLSLFMANKYDESKEYANKAYALNYPLDGLRKLLVDKGFALD